MKKLGALRPFLEVSQILVAVFVFLVGCSKALNYEVARLTDEQRARVRQTLTADQSKKLDDWIGRNMVNKGLPPGVTVIQALEDQEDWLAKQKSDEARAEEQRQKLQAERVAKQAEFAKILSVAIVSKKNEVQEDERRVVSLEILCDNKTDKDIQGVKGVFKLSDIYGKTIIDISWSYDGGISAKQTVVERDVSVPINKLMEPQANLWNTDLNKLKSTFEVNTIIFQDGTSMNAAD